MTTTEPERPASTYPAVSRAWSSPRPRSAMSADVEGFYHYRQYSAVELGARAAASRTSGT